MLGPGRYLLGVAEIAALVGLAWLGAARVRARLLPRLAGPPAHLATAALALALLIWAAELLGTVSLLKPVPYLLLVGACGAAVRLLVPAAGGGGEGPRTDAPARAQDPLPRQDPPAGAAIVPTVIALLVATIAVIHFAAGVKTRLSTGMTGFDSTWYHGPFAAGFFQSGNTIDLHFIAPQFLAWFYPANGELFHAIGMLAFSRDVLSPLLNLGWFLGCLLACWCIGRPYRVAPWSLVLGAVALSVPALSDQAGEARNDIVAIFFLLAAVAIALNARAWQAEEREAGARGAADAAAGEGRGPARPATGALTVVGLAAGLAAGTKLNFLLPAVVLVAGIAAIAPRGAHWRALWVGSVAALAGGGYWYLRNLVHSGNPLPWVHHLGPLTLPAPEQALGGREAHSVLSYLTDGGVWSGWFLPGLHHALWIAWPLLGLAALAGLVLPLLPPRRTSAVQSTPREPGDSTVPAHGPPRATGATREPRDRGLVVAGLAGLASALAWLVAPTSASGPEGIPRGFESGLRYLAPAIVLGLALLPAAPLLRDHLSSFALRLSFSARGTTLDEGKVAQGARTWATSRWAAVVAVVAAGVLVLVGYPIQRHYLRDRYADPSFSSPGLDAAFRWARDLSGARIATTSTRQYPLFGTDLANHVQFIGSERPHGGFEAPKTCRAWRQALNEGGYDYVVTSRDRLEPGKPPYPPATGWTEGPNAEVVLRKPPTVVFRLRGRLDPSSCPG